MAVSFVIQGLFSICHVIRRTFRQPKVLESGADESRGTLLCVGKEDEENQKPKSCEHFIIISQMFSGTA